MLPRLLILSSTYPRWRGDPEPPFVHELARRLTGAFEVTVLAPHAPGAATDEVLDGVRVRRYRYAPARLETLVNDGGIVANLRRSPWKWLLLPGFLLVLAWNCWRLRRTWRPHVIHAHWLLPQGLVAALVGGRDARMLVTSHGADLFALRAAPWQALKRRIVRSAAAVTVVSAPMRTELARIGADVGKVRVAPMGVDLEQRFTPGAEVRTPAELLFVGRLVEKKGLRHLLDALPQIAAAHPAVALTVAGFGPEEGALRTQAARLGLAGRVRFLGPLAQDALPALYRRAAVFVAPFVAAASGDQEGLGLVVLEALGCGCPVVVSDLPPLRDLLGEIAPRALVPPASPAALAAAVGAALADPAAAAAQAAALRAGLRPRFDWAVVTAGYADVLGGLASSATASRVPWQ